MSEIITVSIGPEKAQDILRTTLAMGADRAIHIPFDGISEPLAVAKMLKALAIKEDVSLVLTGKQAIDDDCNQTGQMLATLLNWPQVTFISQLSITDKTAQVTREVDGGLEILAVELPAVITVDLRLNEPRFASLPATMKAKRKPIERIEAEDFAIALAPRIQLLSMCETPERETRGVIVITAAELAVELKSKAFPT